MKLLALVREFTSHHCLPNVPWNFKLQTFIKHLLLRYRTLWQELQKQASEWARVLIMHLFKDLSHLAMLSHQIHHYMETYPVLWISNYSQTSPLSLHILGIRSLCFKKHPRKEDPKLWKSGLFFPSRTEKWVAMEHDSVRLLAVLTFKLMIYFNFSYKEHLKPQK